MNCCINCFESNYLGQIILNNSQKGNCNYCSSKDINIYDPSELSIFFTGILDLYEVDNINGKPIDARILEDFSGKIFTPKVINNAGIKKILVDIIKDDISSFKKIIDNPVSIKYSSNSLQETHIKPLEISWDRLSQEIKTVNRFHFVNSVDIDKLKSIFKYYKKEIIKGKKFYRARIAKDHKGHHLSEMNNPPVDRTVNGRANPNGISYLYLSDKEETTLYETRASLYDFVSVGTFKLLENLVIINLSDITIDIFTFIDEDLLEDIIIHSPFINKLENELSKPHRRGDTDLDYLPTQYLSELIKSMGVDGIEYKSSMHPTGYNLAIFKPEKFKCIDVKVYDIEKIDLKYKLIDEKNKEESVKAETKRVEVKKAKNTYKKQQP